MDNQPYEYDPYEEIYSFTPAPPSEPFPPPQPCPPPAEMNVEVQTQLPSCNQDIISEEFSQSSIIPLPIVPPPPPCPPPPSIISPPPPGHSYNVTENAIEMEFKEENEQTKYIRILKEKEAHDRLIFAENTKRKFIKPVTNFIKSKKIKGFEIDPEVEDTIDSRDVKKEDSNQPLSTSTITAGLAIENSTISTTASNDLPSPELVSLIKKTAAWIVDNTDKAQMLIEKSRNNDKLFFLYDRHCPAGTMYLQELSRYKAEKEVHDIFHGSAGAQATNRSNGSGMGGVLHISEEEISRAQCTAASLAQVALKMQQQVATSHVVSSSAGNNNTNITATAVAAANYNQGSGEVKQGSGEVKSKRKSRWDATADVVATPSSSSIVTSTTMQPILETTTADQIKWDQQIREQKELQLLESRIRQAASAATGSSAHGCMSMNMNYNTTGTGAGTGSGAADTLYEERLREYQDLASRYDAEFKDTVEDAEANGGVVEGGTWEHRKRAIEMLQTAKKNLELTAQSSGRTNTHMGDYLPPHLLDQFLKKSEALKNGQKVLPIDNDNYSQNKLTNDNLGYQMLAKKGWNEGQALGSSSSSSSSGTGGSNSNNGNNSIDTRIIEPISVKGQGTETLGVGVADTHELTTDDSEFDQYRKRMMLAYRFRPNPLNNPRRNYY